MALDSQLAVGALICGGPAGRQFLQGVTAICLDRNRFASTACQQLTRLRCVPQKIGRLRVGYPHSLQQRVDGIVAAGVIHSVQHH
jgi:hypothetical protein